MKNKHQIHGEQNGNPHAQARWTFRKVFEWVRVVGALMLIAAGIFWVYKVLSLQTDSFEYSQVEWFMWISGAVAVLAGLFGWEPRQKSPAHQEAERIEEWERFVTARTPMKYVITLTNKVLIFSCDIRHCDAVGMPKGNDVFPNQYPLALSGGLVRADENGVHCFGDAITLCVESNQKEDEPLVRAQLLKILPSHLAKQLAPQRSAETQVVFMRKTPDQYRSKK